MNAKMYFPTSTDYYLNYANLIGLESPNFINLHAFDFLWSWKFLHTCLFIVLIILFMSLPHLSIKVSNYSSYQFSWLLFFSFGRIGSLLLHAGFL